MAELIIFGLRGAGYGNHRNAKGMQIFQVDTFTKNVFQGNPAAVIPLEEWLPDSLMQRIAMENNLPDTAYLVAEGDDYLIRWFTPTVEVDLCGHATLASGHVLFDHMGFSGDTVVFRSTKCGLLKVSRERRGREDGSLRLLTLDLPANEPQPVDPDRGEAFFEGLQIAPRALYKGTYDYMMVLNSQSQLEALKPDFKRLAGGPGRGLIVTAPGEDADFVSRCFYPQSGIDEDPVTGSAHTMLIPYWAKKLNKKKLSAVQLSSRRGWLDCELVGERVYIGGYAKTYLKGEIFI
jgi:PhzF family phenazine biosynthesis protein